jgi:predicted transcriptional regulator
MNKRQLRFAAFLVFIFILIIPVISADTGGYTVVAIPPDEISGTFHDPVPITFWDLTPREMAIALALSFFPMMTIPVEIFFTMKIFAWLGYRKISKDAFLYNTNRRVIFETIRDHPGISLSRLSQITEIKNATLQYHLKILGLKGKIIRVEYQNTINYFENSGKYTAFEKKVFKHLQNQTTRRILAVLLKSSNISRGDLARKIGTSGPSITWHANRLSQDRIIILNKNGRYVKYILSEEMILFSWKYRNFFPEIEPGRYRDLIPSKGQFV